MMKSVFSLRFLAVVVFLVIAGLSAESVISYYRVVLLKYPLELRRGLTSLPERFGPLMEDGQPRYELVFREPRLHEDVEAELGTKEYISWSYRDHTKGADEPGSMIRLHVPYYTGTIDTVPHVADRCSVAGGATPISAKTHEIDLSTVREVPTADESTGKQKTRYLARSKRGQRVRMASDTVPMRFVQFVAPKVPGTSDKVPDRIYTVGYFFVANDDYVATPEGVRAKAFDVWNRYAYYCKVEVIPGVARLNPRTGKPFTFANIDDEEVARRVTEEFVSYVLPEITLCLPDMEAAEKADGAGEQLVLGWSE